jgi:hypothetical protein
MAAEQDREEILRLHRDWWEANRDWDIPRMRTVFAGERYLQYNLNGHPYYGLGEKTKLWEALAGAITIPDISPPIRLRLEIAADMAWLACDNVVRVALAAGLEVPGLPKTPFRIRSTEVYQRDDGSGNRVWKMWHFHCSPTAGDTDARMPFGDSYATRR